MLMKMLADMVGMTPEKLQAEMEGVMGLIKSSSEALNRIELNQQEIARSQRAILAKLEGKTDDRRDDHPELPGV